VNVPPSGEEVVERLKPPLGASFAFRVSVRGIFLLVTTWGGTTKEIVLAKEPPK
jgi:hypothetical protein